MMERRPAPPKDLEKSVLERLVEPSKSDGFPVFETKQKAMMFAAALGAWQGEPTPLTKRGNGIRFDVFEADHDDGFIRALAVWKTGDLLVLSDERSDERIRIFEEYAHTGLIEMKRVCFEEDGDPLDKLVRLTQAPLEPDRMEIDGIDPSILRGLMP